MPITAQLKGKKGGKTYLKKQMHWDTAPYQAQQEEEGRDGAGVSEEPDTVIPLSFGRSPCREVPTATYLYTKDLT